MLPRIPILNRGIDVFSLPLSTKEGFVLSRIDDVSTVEDISMMVGLKLSELLTMLDRLADLGAVKLAWRVSAPPVATKNPPRVVTGEETAGPLKGTDNPSVQRVLAMELDEPLPEHELDEYCDLSDMLKRRILTAYYGLANKDYYQVLGLDYDADKKAVKAAYFELSRLFHPDSLFGKELGTYKSKMEGVFKRLTEAYEVLGRGQRRKEYDDYLASTRTTSVIQTTIDRVDSQVRALSTAPPAPSTSSATSSAHNVAARSEPAAPVANGSHASSSASANVTNAVKKSIPPQPSDPPRRDGRESQVHARPLSEEDRKAHARERLRRSFAGNSPNQPVARTVRVSELPPSAASVATAAVQQPTAAAAPAAAGASDKRDSALKGLRQSLRQSATGAGGVEPVLGHLRKAREAEQRGDLLGAAAALQAALTLQPNHKDIQTQYERVSRAVTRNLADNYEKQANYEEKQGKWNAAAASWERVSEGRPEDPLAARRVSEALLKASGDMVKAQRFAQRAVDAAPNDSANVVILARVFLAAGQRSNARRELEKAVKLEPQNEMIKNLLREAR